MNNKNAAANKLTIVATGSWNIRLRSQSRGNETLVCCPPSRVVEQYTTSLHSTLKAVLSLCPWNDGSGKLEPYCCGVQPVLLS